MADKQAKKIMQGALLLTLAGFISKVLSATYRIPLQNLTGDIGFYMYQQVYPMIGMATILALYGYPVAVSKIVAERRQNKQVVDFRHVYRPLLIILFIFNGLLAGFIFLFASQFAIWIDDPNLKQPFQLVALLFLLMPFLALQRGISQGYDQMQPTAYSQMAEQLIRVIIIVIGAYLIFTGTLAVGTISTVGVLASLIGMGVASLVWLNFSSKNRITQPAKQRELIQWLYYIWICFLLGIVAAFSHMVLLLLQFVDVITLVPHLIEYGFLPEQAMRQKGILDRGWPLIQFGVVIGSSFALALVPSVVTQSKTRANAIVEAMIFSFYIATGASLGLIVLMPEVNEVLYTNSAGTTSLQILAVTILFSSVAITACAVLQSVGYVKHVAFFILLGFVVKWIFNILLVPNFHILGSAVATVISLFMLMILVINLLKKAIPELNFIKQIRWMAVIISGIGMAIYLFAFKFLVPIPDIRIGLLLYVLFLMISGASIYLFILTRLHAFSDQQVLALPLGDRLVGLKKRIERGWK